MSTVEGGRIGDGKPSSASHESLLGLPDAIDFSHFRKDRVFQQPARADDEDKHRHPLIKFAEQTGLSTGEGDLAQSVDG